MKIKETLKEFYSHWMYLHIKRNGGDYYNKEFLFKQYNQADSILSENKPAIINQAWLKGKCLYCNEKINSDKPVGDHVIPELKKMNIQGFELPCCQFCNSSKNDSDLLEWLERKQRSIFDLHGTVIMVYLRGLWRLFKEQKKLSNDEEIGLNKHLNKLRNISTITVDTKSFSKYEKKQEETFASLGTTKDDWETVEPDGIEYDKYDYPVPQYTEPPRGCKEVTPFFDENFDVSEAGIIDKKQCQLCGTKIDREWYFVCWKKYIYMKIGGVCFKNYSDIEKKDLVKNTIWKMIRNHLIENKYIILKDYWNKWKKNQIYPKKLGYNFSTKLKTITETTSKEEISELVKQMIRLDLSIDNTLSEYIKNIHDRNCTTELKRHVERITEGSIREKIHLEYLQKTQNDRLQEFFWN